MEVGSTLLTLLYIFAASFMSAPAALAMSKLMCPEVDEPAVKDVEDIKVEKTEEKNLFEAVAVGASMSIGLVANIAVMLIAFLSLLAFINGLLGEFLVHTTSALCLFRNRCTSTALQSYIGLPNMASDEAKGLISFFIVSTAPCFFNESKSSLLLKMNIQIVKFS